MITDIETPLNFLNYNCSPKLSLLNQDFEVLVSFESTAEFNFCIDVNVNIKMIKDRT